MDGIGTALLLVALVAGVVWFPQINEWFLRHPTPLSPYFWRRRK